MKNNAHAFVNQLLVCALVTICFGGTVGVGIVWMRHQISVTANTNKVLEARLREIDRQIVEAKTLVESAQSREQLRQLNTNFGLGLVSKSDGQMVQVAGDPVQRAVERSRELLSDRGAPASFLVAPR